MEKTVSYNEFLYQRRKEMGLSRRKFAKFLHVPTFFYRYYEIGYVKPSKKYIQRISEALNIDYESYFEGLASYPGELPIEDTRFERWYKSFIGRLWFKLLMSILSLCSIAFSIFGFIKYGQTMDHAEVFYSEKYIQFVDGIREKGSMTFSLLHELVRPEIHISDKNKYVSISASSENYALRDLNCYINYKEENSNTYYIVPNSAIQSLTTLKVQYVDHTTLKKYISSFTIEDNKFIFVDDISIEGQNEISYTQEEHDFIVSKMKAHIDEVNSDFTSLIKEKLDMDYDFYSELIIDHQKGATENLFTEVLSLGSGIFGIALTGGFFFFLLFAIFFGIKKKKKEDVVLETNTEPTIIQREFKTPKKDIRFFPFIPETIFELVGILLVLFGSIRVIFIISTLFFNNSEIYAENYDILTNRLFIFFTIGMFLLYFIDFDIFLDDKRCLRNFFLYGLVFFGLYIIECSMIQYLMKTRGVALLFNNAYIIPNNFGTISCYFGIMFFLFYEPKWMNTKKKTIIFRCLCSIPILWILISSLIFQNYKSWGLELNTWQIYFFDSERPQFSILCVSYLLGLYCLRQYYKKKYSKEACKKLFNGNRFYFQKNMLVCLIILILALTEFIFRNATNNVKGMGKYWEIIFLVPALFFYHPHLGKRNKPVDYFTLVLYFIFFGFGYFIAGLSLIIVLLS